NLNRFTAQFDCDRLTWPLIIRNRRAGDRMRLKGLGGRKKVKDMFIDHKVPPSIRSKLPMLATEDGRILWLPGIRASDEAPITKSTTRILHIECEQFIL